MWLFRGNGAIYLSCARRTHDHAKFVNSARPMARRRRVGSLFLSRLASSSIFELLKKLCELVLVQIHPTDLNSI